MRIIKSGHLAPLSCFPEVPTGFLIASLATVRFVEFSAIFLRQNLPPGCVDTFDWSGLTSLTTLVSALRNSLSVRVECAVCSYLEFSNSTVGFFSAIF